MGDCFYKNSSGSFKRAEMFYGDGASGKKVIPIFKNQAGDTIQIPQIGNMILNLCSYSFYLNDAKSCSQYIDGSDLDFGKLTWSSSVKSYTPNSFNGLLSENVSNFTGVANEQYALNTNKGVWFFKKSSQPGIGIKLPNGKELLSSVGDSCTISFTFGFNNGTDWYDILQVIGDGNGRNNDGYLRLEKASGNGICLYYTQPSDTKTITLVSSGGHDKIHNVIFTLRRDASNDHLIVDLWFNGVRKATATDFDVFRGTILNLLCLDTKQSGSDSGLNLFIKSLRVWNNALTDIEVETLFKIEARNMGNEVLNPDGINLYDYLTN